jgi:beta-lactam-binding protein with PASTA domain
MTHVAETLADPMLGRLIDGRYELRERVASGGMSTVYIAFDRRLERSVALKVMNPSIAGASGDTREFSSRFRREAKAAARLTHPGLVRVYDQGTDGEISYLTMEYIEGENLRSRLRHESTLPVGEALAITESVLDALAVAHRHGLVHRDVKPENVLLDTDGNPKLADFGLARAITEVTATSTGVIMGTVSYLSPELISRGYSDARSDVYACGILLYEMITGRAPFTGGSAIEIASRHVHEDVPPPSVMVPWVPAEIDELVAVMTARDPASRPPDAALALSRLRQTRATVDDPTLDRRAEPPSGSLPALDDEGRTQVLQPIAAGATVALPIGLGGPIPGQSGFGTDYLDDDPEATAPAREHTRPFMWVLGIIAGALLVLGLGAWWYATQGPGAYTTVPTFDNTTEAEARQALDSIGLLVDLEREYSDDIAEGFVIRTDPAAQAQVPNGSTVALVVSLGPRIETVPRVVGITQGDAIESILDAGFDEVGEITEVYDDHVPAGEVMAANPVAGEMVPHSTRIALTVSLGPEPITIPDVVGMPEAAALTMLRDDYALNVAVVYERTADQPKGNVFRTDPVAGTEGTRTQEMTLYVSDGPPLVTVPDVRGKEFKDAQKELEALGFKVTGKNEAWNFSKVVFSQDPAPNSQVEPGSTIFLEY